MKKAAEAIAMKQRGQRRATSNGAWFITSLVSTLILAVSWIAVAGAGDDTEARSPERVLEALRALEGEDVDAVWTSVHLLEGDFRPGPGDPVPFLLEGNRLFQLPEHGQLAASTLILLSRRDEESRAPARTALKQLAHRGRSATLRNQAIRLLGKHMDQPGEFQLIYPELQRLLESTDDPMTQIACCLALRQLDETTSVHPLRKLLTSSDFKVRSEAALALAETGVYTRQVLRMLRRLRLEPGSQGTRADLLYRLYTPPNGGGSGLQRQVEALEKRNEELRQELASRPGTPSRGSEDVLRELIDLLGRKYVAADRVRVTELYIEAFKGLVASLDHAAFYSREDLHRQSLGQHAGLGARLVKPSREDPLIVTQLLHDPVRPHTLEEGLRTGDRILEIDGVPTAGLDASEIKRRLADKKRGDLVYLNVKRWGRTPWMLTVPFGLGKSPPLFARRLQGDFGYIKLSRIGSDTAEYFATALKSLRDEGLSALILDLRDNSGGALDQAVHIVDLLVDDSRLPIVSERRPDGTPPIVYSGSPGQVIDCPIVVLVNHWTASSAEVIAGALQDFDRAAIVGERTYGKGVSQELVPVSAGLSKLAGGPAQVKIPTYYLHLPLGRPFHGFRDRNDRPIPGQEGGILPDRVIEPYDERFEPWQLEEFQRVRYSAALYRYVDRHFTTIKARYEEGDLWDPVRDPYRDEFYALSRSLNTELGPYQIRAVLRAMLRQYFEEGTEDFAVSRLEGDRVFRGALRVLLGAAKLDVASRRYYHELLGGPDAE